MIPDEIYKEIIARVPIACVDVCIVKDGKILLVKRKDPPATGEWWIPGGRIFKGETMADCAKRKAAEETNIECAIGPIIHTEETVFPDGPLGQSIHSINTCFFVYPVCEKLVFLDEHHSEFKWVNSVSSAYHPYVQHCLYAAGITHKTRD